MRRRSGEASRSTSELLPARRAMPWGGRQWASKAAAELCAAAIATRRLARAPTPPPPCRRTQRYEGHMWVDKKQVCCAVAETMSAFAFLTSCVLPPRPPAQVYLGAFYNPAQAAAAHDIATLRAAVRTPPHGASSASPAPLNFPALYGELSKHLAQVSQVRSVALQPPSLHTAAAVLLPGAHLHPPPPLGGAERRGGRAAHLQQVPEQAN